MKLLLTLFAVLLIGCASTRHEAHQAIHRGDLATAERLLTQSIQQGDRSAWNDLGAVYARQGQRDKAIQHYIMGARWGDPTAQANLAAMNIPVPAPDLAAERSNRNTADTANTLLLMQALQPRPAPAYRAPINCQSFRVGNQISTRCD
jgi:Flp pilus assembly protein TadD